MGLVQREEFEIGWHAKTERFSAKMLPFGRNRREHRIDAMQNRACNRVVVMYEDNLGGGHFVRLKDRIVPRRKATEKLDRVRSTINTTITLSAA